MEVVNFINSNNTSLKIRDSKFNCPLFTIAIPSYGRLDMLKSAIDSALNQNFQEPFELLIVDDNPKREDEIEKYISTIQSDKVSYYKNFRNLGMIGNWNQLYLLAKAKFVIMLHDDDLLAPDYLKIVNNIITTQSAIDGICFRYKTFKNENDIVLDEVNVENPKIKKLTTDDMVIDNICGAPVGLCLRKECVFFIGGFDPYFYPSLDYEFYTRFAKIFNFYQVTSPKLCFWRTQANTSSLPDTWIGFLDKDYQIKKKILSEKYLFFQFIFLSIIRYLQINKIQVNINAYSVKNIEARKFVKEHGQRIRFYDEIIGRFYTCFQKTGYYLNKIMIFRI